MPDTTNTHDHFKFTYRADCTTCGSYVGPKRKSKPEAEADIQSHKSQQGHSNDEVKIEVTQSYYIHI